MKANAARYRGQWIALKDGELVASASTPRDLKGHVKDLTGFFVTKVV
jgi:hypothetical protein